MNFGLGSRAAAGLTLAAAISTLFIGTARAQAGQPNFISNDVKYRDSSLPNATGRSGNANITARALLGKDYVTDLEVTTGALDSAAAPGNISKLQLKIFSDTHSLETTQNYNGLSGGGYVHYQVNGLHRHQPLQEQTSVTRIDTPRTDVVTSQEVVKLRPDLSPSDLQNPTKADVNTIVHVSAAVKELNGDVGARANAVLYVDGTAVDQANNIWVDAGGSVGVAFTHTFTTVGTHSLSVALENVVPGDYDASNNAVSGTIDIVQPLVTEVYSAFALDEDILDAGYRTGNNYWDGSFSDSWLTTGWDQEASIRVFSPSQMTFPVQISAVETSDGQQVSSVSRTLSPIWAFYGFAYGQSFDYPTDSTLWVETAPWGTYSGYQRYSDDVTYFSYEYSSYSGATGNYYIDAVGSRLAMGSQHGITLALTDASGTNGIAPALITMTPFVDQNTSYPNFDTYSSSWYGGWEQDGYRWDYSGTEGSDSGVYPNS